VSLAAMPFSDAALEAIKARPKPLDFSTLLMKFYDAELAPKICMSHSFFLANSPAILNDFAYLSSVSEN
jgi:hypothetical protein